VKEGLRFAEAYGLTLDSASFIDQKGVSHTLALKMTKIGSHLKIFHKRKRTRSNKSFSS